MNIGLLFHLGQYLGMGILEHMVKGMLKFIEAVKLFLEWLFHFAFPSAMYEISVALHSQQHLVLSLFSHSIKYISL